MEGPGGFVGPLDDAVAKAEHDFNNANKLRIRPTATAHPADDAAMHPIPIALLAPVKLCLPLLEHGATVTSAIVSKMVHSLQYVLGNR